MLTLLYRCKAPLEPLPSQLNQGHSYPRLQHRAKHFQESFPIGCYNLIPELWWRHPAYSKPTVGIWSKYYFSVLDSILPYKVSLYDWVRIKLHVAFNLFVDLSDVECRCLVESLKASSGVNGNCLMYSLSSVASFFNPFLSFFRYVLAPIFT